MDFVFVPLLVVARTLVGLYGWVVITGTLLTWLAVLHVVNPHHQVVHRVLLVCRALTEPLMAPQRRRLPFVGGMDLSPLIVLAGVYFIEIMLGRLLMHLA